MNTAKIKAYAPAARRDFIAAVIQRLNLFGISTDKQGKLHVEPATVTGSVLQVGGQTFDARLARARERLVARAQAQGMTALVEQVAYTWFNRLCAIRFMELQGYLEHGFRVLSHPEQAKGFQVLDHVPEVAEQLGLEVDHLVGLKLAGNQDEALFRAILLGQCHALHQAMPFLFEALEDDTELLLPDNLTRTDSLLRPLVDSIPETDWQQVEIIGWLYQFYIAERKDQVIGSVVKSEDIPAATQLFTPNWIVQYLVQNSIGRQWLQTYPQSGLKAQMPYYIEPAEQTPEVQAQLAALTPESLDPEALKVLDPACGSGHILVEAYKVLKAIYEERGYRSREIPQLILEKNLFGLDIDERAAQLAGFALLMLARADDRRIFTRQVKLNVVALKEPPSPALPPQGGQGARDTALAALWRNLNLRGDWQKGTSADLFGGGQIQLGDAANDPVYQLLLTLGGLFRDAKTFGSLIDVPAKLLVELQALRDTLAVLAERGDTMQQPAALALLPLVRQAMILAQRYDAVVANPPYMGSKGMNADLKTFAGKHFPNSKSDLFAMFMERAFGLLTANGYNAQVNMQSWMFLSSYEKLRESLLDTKTIQTLMQIGYNSFPELNSKIVQCVAFSMQNAHIDGHKGTYINLNSAPQSANKNEVFLSRNNSIIFNITQYKFKKIPGNPIAYWVSDELISSFGVGLPLDSLAKFKAGMSTGDNVIFQRLWCEVNFCKIRLATKTNGDANKFIWFPCNSGGIFRKWYGNNEIIVNWENNGERIRNHKSSAIRNSDYYFMSGLTYSKIGSGIFAARYKDAGYIFDDTGRSIFVENSNEISVLSFLCSKLSNIYLSAMAPTVSFTSTELGRLPFIDKNKITLDRNSSLLISEHRKDWDSFEGSWDFVGSPLLAAKRESVKLAFATWQTENTAAVTEMQRLEEENNRLFIDAYGLQDELTPDVPLEQITLTVNPRYRYGGNATPAELSLRFQSDTCAELISYAIGCMMGRYRVDRAGLVYAHAGNVDFTNIYGDHGAFPPDADGILPLTDQEWFADDATNRFREFVRVVWGETRLQENLEFVAQSLTQYALKPKRDESSLDTIRRYLATQFYKDHLRTYKKRPIYWLFSSGKHKAFECLVYLHRYHEGTLARMRTEYVTPLLGKYSHYAAQLEQQADAADSTTDKNRLKKELADLEKRRAELRAFDDQLKHYADRRIRLDLDDGVKVNYGKFGELLAEVKAVTGGKE